MNDTERFNESKNYNSPESLLLPSHWSYGSNYDETIYFNQNGKKLKSLNRYFCNSDNTIDYKNKFANNFLKNHVNGTKKSIWKEFITSINKITKINILISSFNDNNKKVNNTEHSINIVEETHNYKLIIKRKSYSEEILFDKSKNFHLLTLFILLETNNGLCPLIFLNYEIKARLLIEYLLVNEKEWFICIMKKYYKCTDDSSFNSFFDNTQSIFTEWGTIFSARLDKLMSQDNFDNYYKTFFEEFLGTNFSTKRSGNNIFFNNIDDESTKYEYSDTRDYYLTFSDIDSGMNYLRVGDLVYYNYLSIDVNNFMSAIIYGFGHELAHHITGHLINKKCTLTNTAFITDNNESINDFVAGKTVFGREKIEDKWVDKKIDTEIISDLISYNIHSKILTDHFKTLSNDIKKDMVKNIFLLACGDRTNNSHADTMIRTMYIRFIPDYDDFLPQDNIYYKKYLKYKNKYLALKK